MAGQSISGISAAVFGVMLPLVAADLTSDRRHFNLCIGAFGLCSAAGATLSTAVGGWISDNAGQVPAFLALAAAGLAGTLAIWALMPETAPILETRRVVTRGLQARTAASRGCPVGLGRDEDLPEIQNWKWGNPISMHKSS